MAVLAVVGGMMGRQIEARTPPRSGAVTPPIALEVRLSDGSGEAASPTPTARATGVALAQERSLEMLKMFTEPLESHPDRPEFFQRPSSQPAPRSITPVKVAFPPKETRDAPDVKGEAPKVVSITPNGAVERAPRLTITFSRPMIAVSDPSAAEAGDPLGITIEPRPAGAWRWLGTQTVIFEPAGGEFPRATEYKVTVPATVVDTQGQKLSQAASANFSLPRPKAVAMTPSSSGHGLQPVLTVTFDQPVERSSVLSKIALRSGDATLPLRELTVAEAEAEMPGTEARYKKARKDTVFLWTPQKPLQPGTSYQLQLPAGVKSQEGPLLSQEPRSSSFSTYDPLQLAQSYPRPEDKASPLVPLTLSFNNALDRASFQPSFVTVKPAIPDMTVRLSGKSLVINGAKKGKSNYQVTVSAQLTDVFEQKLGEPAVANFTTGSAPKALLSTYETMTVLDPGAKAALPLYTTNIDKLDLTIHKVEPKDWAAYLQFTADRWRPQSDPARPKLPGTQVKKSSLTLQGDPDALGETRVDLSEYLPNGQGNVVVWITDPSEDKERYRRYEVLTWVQGTKLGLDLEISHAEAVALVTDLKDAKPITGATVTLGQASATTNAEGTAVFALPPAEAHFALVKAGNEQAFLPRSSSPHGYGNSWSLSTPNNDSRWLLFDDRGLYKPGETAHVKGYVRQWSRGPQAALTSVGKPGSEVTWTLNDPRGNKLSEGSAQLSAFGTIDFTVEFPPDTNLGHHQLRISGSELPMGYHTLNVQEFRRPEFEVTTSVASDGPHLLQESATVQAKAVYYAGGSLSGSTVNWEVSTSTTDYTPPGRDDYTFGRWTPWWDMGPWWLPAPANHSYESFEGQTNGEGEHNLNIDFLRVHPPQPTSVTATASVADVNRQQRSGSLTLLVHPSARYVGLKTEKSFVDDKSNFELEAIVTDIDGNMQMGVPIAVTLLEVGYDYDENGEYRQLEKPVQTLAVTSAEVPVKLTLSPPRGGAYRIRAEVSDQQNRLNRTDYTMWKAGGMLPSKDKVEVEALTMIPDRKQYSPGETANILVMAPFAEGEGLVIWSRDGLLKQERFRIKQGSATIEYPISEELVPNLHARVTVVGKTAWGQRERPAIAEGSLNLSISKASRKLSVELLPVDAKLEPGAEVEVQAVVKDANGRPVAGSEVTLWMVDEALLGLTNYQLPQPLDAFYSDRPAGFNSYHLRSAIALAAPDLTAAGSNVGDMADRAMYRSAGGYLQEGQAPPAPAMAAPSVRREKGAAEEAPAASFVVRKNFDALAIYRGALATDASGKTAVKVKLPDNLTRYRIFSLAIQDHTFFGSGDQLLTARLPVMVRPSLPRFLNFGDQAQLPVVVQNQTDKALEVEIVGEATGVTWLGAAGQKVTVPANDRVEVMFQARADQVGIAHFRFGAVAPGGRSDAATLSLPVYTPASGEAFATYGSLSEKESAIAQPVQRPGDVWPQFGGLQVSLSSTALSELTDAFLYLYTYPFECAEQKASRVLSIAALHDVLEAFNAEGLPDPKVIQQRMAEDISFLLRLQNSDGGWGFWRRDDSSIPFVSLHVSHALVRAKLSGHKVEESALQRSMEYLKSIEAKCQALKYSAEVTRSVGAYAVYVRQLHGDGDLAKAKKLFAELTADKAANLEALGWLWPTLHELAKGGPEATELRRLVLNRATETADKAQFTMNYGEGDGEYLLLHSSRRTDAILLYALLQSDPSNALNTKLVRGLLAHRKKGRWESTQENSWVLLALQQYFRTFEKEAPDFVARVWLENDYLGEERFQGRSNKEAQVQVPMTSVPEKAAALIVGKTGPGRLYYRVGMNYAPKSLRLPAEDRGFTVERKYRGLDAPGDVSRNEQGDWTVKAGAKVEVEVSMVVPERRYHVALVDPLPAGLEPLNPTLAGTPPVSTGGEVDASLSWWRWWHWYEHENLRDERAEVFASLLYPGVYTYRYTAIATTPGEYILPPTKAEEMYSPEVFGRNATGRLTVVNDMTSGK